jgi:hypothetical protein
MLTLHIFLIFWPNIKKNFFFSFQGNGNNRVFRTCGRFFRAVDGNRPAEPLQYEKKYIKLLKYFFQ